MTKFTPIDAQGHHVEVLREVPSVTRTMASVVPNLWHPSALTGIDRGDQHG